MGEPCEVATESPVVGACIDVIRQRGTVAPEVLVALTEDDIMAIYEWLIGPAIDRLEAFLVKEWPVHTFATPGPGDVARYDASSESADPLAPHASVRCAYCGEAIRRLGGPGSGGFWFHDGGEEACNTD